MAFFVRAHQNAACVSVWEPATSAKLYLNSSMAHSGFLQEHNGIQVKIAGISNTSKMVFDADGISLDTLEG